ncbi:MAG: exodeoxyribonuclease V subunit gamma, partial [Chitinivibrionales bacterium]
QETRHQEWEKALFLHMYRQSTGYRLKLSLQEMFLEKLRKQEFRTRITKRFPRVTLFGLSILNARQIEILNSIAGVIDLNVFLLNPCMEYWYDLIPEKRRVFLENSSKREGISPDTRSLDTINPLLANNGIVGQDIFKLFFRHEGFLNTIDLEMFDPPPEDSLLHIIQNNIIRLRDTESSPSHEPDSSVLINSNYSPAREIEVLYNHILDRMERSGINPEDVLIITPDIDPYVPFIRAVFDSAEHGIPYYIADQSFFNKEGVSEVLEKILALPFSNFGAETILEIAESEPLMKSFNIKDTKRIREIVHELNIRWGVDRESAEAEGIPDNRFHTWRYALKRAMLSFAIKSDDSFITMENEDYILRDIMEGKEINQLLPFVSLIDELCSLYEDVNSRMKRPLTEWTEFFEGVINRFFSVEEISEEELGALTKETGFIRDIILNSPENDESVDYIVVKDAFLYSVKQGKRSGFLSKGVTFSSMVPMRSLPFKMIGVIGLNSDAFPRKENSLDIDLLTKEEKTGDRNIKNNDRYLFLETILSAREILYLSYIGRDVHDNSEKSPSILIEEFFRYINTTVCRETEGALEIVQHPLYGFSRKYFIGDRRFFTYTEDNIYFHSIPPREHSVTVRKHTPPETLDLDELVNFYKSPAKWFYNNILGVYLNDSEEGQFLSEEEMLELDDPVVEHRIKNAMLYEPEHDFIKSRKMKGELPLGNLAGITIENIKEEYRAIYDTYTAEKRDEILSVKDSKEIMLDSTGVLLKGRIDGLFKDETGSVKLIIPCFSGINSMPRYLIEVMIKHLFLSQFTQDLQSVLIYLKDRRRGGVSSIVLRDNLKTAPYTALQRLIQHFVTGNRYVLPFTPGSGYEYFKRKNHPGKNEKKRPELAAYSRFTNETEYDKYSENEFPGFFSGKSFTEFTDICNDVFNVLPDSAF